MIALFAVTEQTVELTLPSRIESIEETSVAAARVISRAGLSEDVGFGLDLAVREAVANAVIHGNQRDEAKAVDVTLTATSSDLIVTVRDRGPCFDPADVPDPTDAEHLLSASGRGILFMRTYMDEVVWSRHPEGGTVVRMTKKL